MRRREGEVSAKERCRLAAVNSRWGALAATLWHRLEGKPAQGLGSAVRPRPGAFYTMVGGIVGTVLAGFPGFIDYRTITDSTVKKVAMAHMLMNLATVGLFAINLWLRAQRPAATRVPIILSAVGVILLGIAGWLGGELVYHHAMGVEVQLAGLRQKPDRHSM